MAQIREIKKRMVAVGTIQRITKTMQMIATAKFTAAVQRTKATQPYTEKIRELVAAVKKIFGHFITETVPTITLTYEEAAANPPEEPPAVPARRARDARGRSFGVTPTLDEFRREIRRSRSVARREERRTIRLRPAELAAVASAVAAVRNHHHRCYPQSLDGARRVVQI